MSQFERRGGPKVSVIVPNYNHAKYLPERIDSVLSQTFQDIEIILLDDCSQDDSVSVLKQYENHPLVSHVVINDANSGSPFKQWNRGVRLSEGEYIWIAEADDVADPRLLESLVTQLDQDPNTVLAFCQSMIIDGEGQPVGIHPQAIKYFGDAEWKNNFQMPGKEFVEKYLFLVNAIPNASAVVFRRDTYVQSGWADETYTYVGDWKNWSKLCLHDGANVFFCAEPLNYFRRHGGSVRSSVSKSGKMLSERCRYWREAMRGGAISTKTQLARIHQFLFEWLEHHKSEGKRTKLQVLKHLLMLRYRPLADMKRFRSAFFG